MNHAEIVAVHAADPTAETAALVAEHVGDNEWDALWTFDDDRIRTATSSGPCRCVRS